ncbi:MAG: transcriptional regulator [Spirochaetaceae bacterium]|nr:MAG: transcriptional regulator [Spirochaetaceae bacterium]
MQAMNETELGRAIRARRKELGVTQKELALACGTGVRFIIDLERGKSTVQIGKALQVIRGLGMAVEVRPAHAGGPVDDSGRTG